MASSVAKAKARLAEAGSSISGSSNVGSDIASSVAEAKARLAKAAQNMHNNTTQTNTTQTANA